MLHAEATAHPHPISILRLLPADSPLCLTPPQISGGAGWPGGRRGTAGGRLFVSTPFLSLEPLPADLTALGAYKQRPLQGACSLVLQRAPRLLDPEHSDPEPPQPGNPLGVSLFAGECRRTGAPLLLPLWVLGRTRWVWCRERILLEGIPGCPPWAHGPGFQEGFRHPPDTPQDLAGGRSRQAQKPGR